MAHSLSHALMSEVAIDCGYPASALKERIYVLPRLPGEAIRCGVLIYTASAGNQGTLGRPRRGHAALRPHPQVRPRARAPVFRRSRLRRPRSRSRPRRPNAARRRLPWLPPRSRKRAARRATCRSTARCSSTRSGQSGRPSSECGPPPRGLFRRCRLLDRLPRACAAVGNVSAGVASIIRRTPCAPSARRMSFAARGFMMDRQAKRRPTPATTTTTSTQLYNIVVPVGISSIDNII